ncbi:cyclase family protein [Rhizobium sp. BK060]|uniref:cyclase family protein n=1 Tax=Rhizobium sp. BK060 TaxID=2587096 RepID=UPI00161229D0|nr:cyclase family protein [Rhizobium sp. BK060]MBB3394260.1 kynurenine formamidase [Rhizobium sp. BK060]
MPQSQAEQLLSLMKNAKYVDLSVTTGVNLPSSPYEGQPFGQFLMNKYDWPRGKYLEYVQIHDDHTGTHIDSPSHFTPTLESGLPHATEFGSVTVEQLKIEWLIGEAIVVDCRPLIDGYPKGETTNLRESPIIERSYLEKWERENGAFAEGQIVLLRSDWSDTYYKPIPEGFKYDRSNPAPSAEAIEFLYQRGVRHIGIDARSIGQMQDDNSPHWASLGRGMYVTENLTNLGKIPARGSLFVFLPHKFDGATGGLGRAIGVVA